MNCSYYCASTVDTCPSYPGNGGRQQLVALLPLRVEEERGPCKPDQKECEAGCCPYINWVCCEDNKNCAATVEGCPTKNGVRSFSRLVEVEVAAARDDDNHGCPPASTYCEEFNGCCMHENWFCCPGQQYCADVEADCPPKPFYL